MSDSTPPDDFLANSLQGLASTDDELEGAVLVGFVMVSEWVDPEGQRWLSQRSWTPSGPPATWTLKGWLHEALFSGFHTDE